MTAEAVVFNKSAVAMAADSAVTIPRGPAGSKIFDTANKLFELVKGRPVGIMIYSSAELNGVPWETIIKSFRSDMEACCFDSLAEYVDAFIAYLSHKDCFLFPRESETLAFDLIAYRALSQVVDQVKQQLRSCLSSTGRVVQTRLRRVLDSAFSEVEKVLNAHDDGNWPGLNLDVLKADYESRAEELVDEVFLPEMHLRTSEKKRLIGLAIQACLKEFGASDGSGIVIAGYGNLEAFPSVHSLRIHGRLSGVLRVIHDAPIEIAYSGPAGGFRTFAQDEMAQQFVTGINERTRREVIEYWQKWVTTSNRDLATRVGRAHPRLGARTLGTIRSEHRKLAKEGFDSFLTHMNEHQTSAFVLPLMRSIGYLPKDELAHMAETLVNLTSVIQRFSVHQDETVGGEIDVALISRGDGLVWVKRKHYFSLELNPTWPAMHRGTKGMTQIASDGGTND